MRSNLWGRPDIVVFIDQLQYEAYCINEKQQDYKERIKAYIYHIYIQPTPQLYRIDQTCAVRYFFVRIGLRKESSAKDTQRQPKFYNQIIL